LRVNGQPVEPILEAQDSALRVTLPSPLAPGQAAVIHLNFAVTVPSEEGGNYGTFAYVNEVLALAHAYPMIAVYDDEGWNIEIAPSVGDVVYADTSFYLVQVTAPAELVMAVSGVEIERQADSAQQIVTYAAGPMRDFYLAASPTYTVVTATVGETTVNSYAPAGLDVGAAAVSEQALAALASFNDRFGVYPYTEFDLVSTTTSALGVEYPGIVAILVGLYQPEGETAGLPNVTLLESVVAHEVAHQWFYGLIGNDQIDEPWLDEALAQFLTLVYFSDVHGPQGATGFHGSLEGRWRRVDLADIPIGLPVAGYSPQEYSAIVYGRGPLFIEALSQEMGPDVFADFMRDYFQTYEFEIATGADFKALAEQHCDCDLTPLFEEWVLAKEG
jgi:aminopeptidase N